jgi:hypothetical protein
VKGGSNPEISGEANWIWTQDHDAHNDVFCRIAISLTGAPGSGGGGGAEEPICVAAMDVADFTYTGSAKVDDSDASVMSITQTANSQQGTGMLPVTVTAEDNLAITFQMLTGGGSGADGMCMNLGGNSLGGRYGEDGVSVGLAVCFDEWSNGNHEHGVMMFWNGGSAGDTHSGAGTGGVIWYIMRGQPSPQLSLRRLTTRPPTGPHTAIAQIASLAHRSASSKTTGGTKFR